jgi:hypothetical protein
MSRERSHSTSRPSRPPTLIILDAPYGGSFRGEQRIHEVELHSTNTTTSTRPSSSATSTFTHRNTSIVYPPHYEREQHLLYTSLFENARECEQYWGKEYCWYTVRQLEALLDLVVRGIEVCDKYVLLSYNFSSSSASRGFSLAFTFPQHARPNHRRSKTRHK